MAKRPNGLSRLESAGRRSTKTNSSMDRVLIFGFTRFFVIEQIAADSACDEATRKRIGKWLIMPDSSSAEPHRQDDPDDWKACKNSVPKTAG